MQSNCVEIVLPLLSLPLAYVKCSLRCILHTLLFCRQKGAATFLPHARLGEWTSSHSLVPPGLCTAEPVMAEPLSVAYFPCTEEQTQCHVETKVLAFAKMLERGPCSSAHLSLSFYHVRSREKVWGLFKPPDEKVFFERWVISVQLIQPYGSGCPSSTSAGFAPSLPAVNRRQLETRRRDWLSRDVSAEQGTRSLEGRRPGDAAVCVPSPDLPYGDMHVQRLKTRSVANEQKLQPFTVSSRVKSDADLLACRVHQPRHLARSRAEPVSSGEGGMRMQPARPQLELIRDISTYRGLPPTSRLVLESEALVASVQSAGAAVTTVDSRHRSKNFQAAREKALCAGDWENTDVSRGSNAGMSRFNAGESERSLSPARDVCRGSSPDRVLQGKAAGRHDRSSYAGRVRQSDTHQERGDATVSLLEYSPRGLPGTAVDWRSLSSGPPVSRGGSRQSVLVARQGSSGQRMGSRERRYSDPASEESGKIEGDVRICRRKKLHRDLNLHERAAHAQTRNPASANRSHPPEDRVDREGSPTRREDRSACDKREASGDDQERPSASSWLLQEERAAQRRVEHAVRLAMLKVIQLSAERQWHLPPPSPGNPMDSCMYR
ncbi:hypothetical protein CSUI_000729 [Cystoisospora suis]|uniref:Autophagy-related protein 101 n=1 Tax=Cystoisospora suis TaxID=483139 RepID=A0A2C6LB90_9APIC|nr:hypothetical protein CSUI_000729 [Cystoisospora suis]